MRAVDPRLLRHARSTRGYLGLSVAVGVATAAVVIANATLLAHVIDGAFLGGLGLADLSGPVAALAGLVLVRASLAWATEVLAHRAAARATSELRGRFLERVTAEGPLALADRDRGAVALTATRGIEALDGYFSRYLPQVALAVAVPAMAAAWIWPRDRLTVLILAVTLPLIPLFMVLIGRMAQRRAQAQWRTMARLGSHFLDVLQGLPTLKAYGRARHQREQVANVAERLREGTLRTLRVAFLSSAWLELMATIGVALVAVGVGLRLVEGSLDFRTGLAVLILAPEIYMPVRQLGQHFHSSTEGLEAAGPLLDVVDAQPRPPSGVLAPPELNGASIRLDDVHLAYAGREEGALRGLGLVIGPGEHLAVVGATGGGKSTLLALLLGFAVPDDGSVEVVGALDPRLTALSALDLHAWRRQIAWVPQRPHLLTATVAENVRLGAPAASDAQVRRALELAGATTFVDRLARGIDTELGERAVRLSAGERRRIAIARAFVRDAPLLLLDEPTADLDLDSEAVVRDSVRRLAGDRTVVVVTHRLGLATDADRVAVIDGGRLVEHGPPGLLAAAGGPFAALQRGRVTPTAAGT